MNPRTSMHLTNAKPLHTLLMVSCLVAGAFGHAQDARGKRPEDSRTQRTPVPPSSETPEAMLLQGLPFRITVDGQPVDGEGLKTGEDVQRQADLALAKADIQIQYDPSQAKACLNAWSYPDALVRGAAVEFGTWSNYTAWIDHAEIRVFSGRRAVGKPLAVIPVRMDGFTSWSLPGDAPEDMVFLLRVYDRQGHFDETATKPLRLLAQASPARDLESPARERFTGWGQDARALVNIPVYGGTVTVHGTGLRPDQRVEALGASLPVDAKGAFAAKQILPAGPHTVSVSVIEPDGRRSTYSRSLTLADKSWFYVALADLTLGRNHVSGPARLVTGDTQHYEGKTYVDGRGAFYLKGLIKGRYLLTASADTGEQPVEDLFHQFASKDPRYLLRRIDPDRYYPVYGDDSTSYEDAPTRGKFYVRLERGDSHVLWGSFKTEWTGSELAQYARALYGAKLRLATSATTPFGEKRASLDGFAAEPGTLQSVEEYRATGGSLYFLKHLDISQGSEQVWAEVRDEDSGQVLERRQLVPAQDYELNTLQGRLVLSKPLASVSGSGSLFSRAGIPGQPVYLRVTYEYAPSTTSLDTFSHGLRAQGWVNAHLRLGITGYRQGGEGQHQRVEAADLVLRATPGTYLKVEAARARGEGSGQQNSLDGGFAFSSSGAVGQRADAVRVEAQIDHADVHEGAKGQTSLYFQDKEKGFSGPGQLTPGQDETVYGLRTAFPLGEAVGIDLKADRRDTESQDTRTAEGTLRWKLTPEWTLSAGLRHDDRETRIPSASERLSEQGRRTDAQMRLGYRPEHDGVPGPWDAYGFLQGTLSRDRGRRDNDRAGLGGSWQATSRLKLSAEASGGDGGAAGLLGGDYRVNDRSSIYLNHRIETERPDADERGRYDTTVAGTRFRVNDQVSVFGETKRAHGADSDSLGHAFGLDYAPTDRWTFGLKADWGIASEPYTEDIRRRTFGFSASYKVKDFTYAGNLEYRRDENGQGDRTVWLVRNALSWKASDDWRWFGKLNFSTSRNSRGVFEDGNYVELVTGGAYRPVRNDRWNTLFTYTYLKDAPTTGQVSGSGRSADYQQRSHVVAVDTIHDLNPRLSLGAKLAWRRSLLKPTRGHGDWFDSQAWLGVVRADFHIVQRWDWMAEYRMLRVTEAEDRRSGFLTAVYYRFGRNLKAGVGYNFTDFSDDLTDLSYRSRGVFINVVGQF